MLSVRKLLGSVLILHLYSFPEMSDYHYLQREITRKVFSHPFALPMENPFGSYLRRDEAVLTLIQLV